MLAAIESTTWQERKRRFKAGLLPAPLGFEVWGLGVGGVADESQRLELPALAALLRSLISRVQQHVQPLKASKVRISNVGCWICTGHIGTNVCACALLGYHS